MTKIVEAKFENRAELSGAQIANIADCLDGIVAEIEMRDKREKHDRDVAHAVVHALADAVALGVAKAELHAAADALEESRRRCSAVWTRVVEVGRRHGHTNC